MLKAIVNSPVRSGDQTINDGNLVIGTAGKGIDFSSSSHASGMTSEVLTDYEEGTFTPTVTFSGGNGNLSYAAQSGRYVKVGRSVHVQAYIEFAIGSATGAMKLSGLPFAAAGGNAGFAGVFIGVSGFTGITGAVFGLMDPGATTVTMCASGTGTIASVTDTNLGASSWVSYSFSYQV